ncbi:prothoracicostatic peptides-like [Ornithodoros turicata]
MQRTNVFYSVRLSALSLAVLVIVVALVPVMAQMHEGRDDWNSLSGMWGKRAANDWNRLSGMWGKRAASPYEALGGPLGQALWLRAAGDDDRSHGIRARAAPADNHWNGLSGYWG